MIRTRDKILGALIIIGVALVLLVIQNELNKAEQRADNIYTVGDAITETSGVLRIKEDSDQRYPSTLRLDYPVGATDLIYQGNNHYSFKWKSKSFLSGPNGITDYRC